MIERQMAEFLAAGRTIQQIPAGAIAGMPKRKRRSVCRAASVAAMVDRNTKYRITHDGVTDSLMGHCRRLGLPKTAVYESIRRKGLTPVEALRIAVAARQ